MTPSQKPQDGGVTIDWTKPIETADGSPARVLATDLACTRPVVVAVATKGLDYETVLLLNSEGSYDKGKPPIVRNVPPAPMGRYFNVYRDGSISAGHENRADADDYQGPDRIACVRVEFKEGQFDD